MKYPILCQIMPPDLLKQLLGQVPEEEKNIVLRTIIIDSKMRERRAIMGSMSSMFPLAGEKVFAFLIHITQRMLDLLLKCGA